MKTYTPEQLQEIVNKHAAWTRNTSGSIGPWRAGEN